MTRRSKRRPKAKTSPNTGRAFQELVADIVRALDSGATVKASEWVVGPDGRRDLDVTIRGELGGKPYLAMVECKDYTARSTGKVGIELIDALESKRKDVGADAALMCSNSGFTTPALAKAKRVGIVPIAAVRKGDGRIKTAVQRVYFTPFVRFKGGSISVTTNSTLPSDLGDDEILSEGVSLRDYLFGAACRDRLLRPSGGTMTVVKLRPPSEITCTVRGVTIRLQAAELTMSSEVRWMSQLLTIDATAGIYNFVRRKLLAGPGSIEWKNFSTDPSKLTVVAPEDVGEIFTGDLRDGEVDIHLAMLEGAPDGALSAAIPFLDSYVTVETSN